MHAKDADVPAKRRFAIRCGFWGLSCFVVYYLLALAPLPFIQSWWNDGLKGRGENWHVRHRMAEWMLISHSLTGLARPEVVSRLGEPEPTDYFKEWSMVYMLGPERRFMSIDSEWLVLRLDEAGRVTEIRIVND